MGTIDINMDLNECSAEQLVEIGIAKLLNKHNGVIASYHIEKTPQRFVKALQEFFSGVNEDPKSVLATAFASEDDEMVIVKSVDFFSFCAHHLLPFIGKVHFAYIPKDKIVGLSKVPRLIEILTHRPQVQEQLTKQIADTFTEVINPLGCGVVVEAEHMCMRVRGVKKANSTTETIALRGCFKEPATKQEFLSRLKK